MWYKLKRILIYPDGVTEKQVYPALPYQYSYDFRNKTTAQFTADGWTAYEWTPSFNADGIYGSSWTLRNKRNLI